MNIYGLIQWIENFQISRQNCFMVIILQIHFTITVAPVGIQIDGFQIAILRSKTLFLAYFEMKRGKF